MVKRIPKAPKKEVFSKAHLEARMQELREKFETGAKEIDVLVKETDSRKAELVRMQTEYKALETLLNNYSW